MRHDELDVLSIEPEPTIVISAGACPLVSVIVPTLNRPDMVGRSARQRGAQTFTDYEIIVISNGESMYESVFEGVPSKAARVE